ncbi:MAG: GGDEF domain-containing protein [Acidimicrobiales bacterium]
MAAEGGPFDTEAVQELFYSWNQRCSATGCATGPEDRAQRIGLLAALERAAAPNALARVRGILAAGGPRPTLPRAAGTIGARRGALEEASRAWGSSIGSPSLVVEQMLLLRHLVSGSVEGDRLGRLVDRSMLVATRAATDELQRAAFSDPLTGCANRRALERDLERELARCARAELDLCVVAIDVDGLKHFNDTQGHAAGDRILLQLVETLRGALRGLDGVYRVGGDEFIIVLPDTSSEGAEVVMARLENAGAPSFSWGIATVGATGELDAAALLRAADAELYDRRRARRGLARTSGPLAHQRPPGSVIRIDRQAGAIG